MTRKIYLFTTASVLICAGLFNSVHTSAADKPKVDAKIKTIDAKKPLRGKFLFKGPNYKIPKNRFDVRQRKAKFFSRLAPKDIIEGGNGKLTPLIYGGINFDGCSPQQMLTAGNAFGILLTRFSTQYTQFQQCLDDAYMVEHRNQDPSSIAIRFESDKIVQLACRNLPSPGPGLLIQGQGEVDIDEERFALNSSFLNANASNPTVVASVMGHELSHNFGYRHVQNPFGSQLYSNTVPEQVEACILGNAPNSYAGPGSANINPNNIIGMSIGRRSWHWTWYRDGTVGAGSSDKLHRYRTLRAFSLAPGYGVNDVVAMATDARSDRHYVFYRDGMMSGGHVEDLDSFRTPYSYNLPVGKTPNDIVAIAINGARRHTYVWYNDQTWSAGTTRNLGSVRQPSRFQLPPGKSASDIIDIGSDDSNNWVFAWYQDRTVSAGTAGHLYEKRRPYSFGSGR